MVENSFVYHSSFTGVFLALSIESLILNRTWTSLNHIPRSDFALSILSGYFDSFEDAITQFPGAYICMIPIFPDTVIGLYVT